MDSSLSKSFLFLHVLLCLLLLASACSPDSANIHSAGPTKAALCSSLRPSLHADDAPNRGEHLVFSGPEAFDYFEFNAEQRVANGRVSTKGEGGAVVSLHAKLSDTRSFACTGSRSSTNWVLTAAHCFFDPKNEMHAVTSVEIANNSLHKDTGEIVTGKAFCHSEFGFRRSNYANDIALVELARSIDGPTMALVRKSESPMEHAAGRQLVTILGFGKLAPDKESDVLMAGEVFTAPDFHRCTRGSGFLNTFCTTTVGIDGVLPSSLCPGDSGGPALVRSDDGVARQVGVNSFIGSVEAHQKPTCGKPGNFSGFVDIWHYRAWIEAISGI